jgi:hypothetical protein
MGEDERQAREDRRNLQIYGARSLRGDTGSIGPWYRQFDETVHVITEHDVASAFRDLRHGHTASAMMMLGETCANKLLSQTPVNIHTLAGVESLADDLRHVDYSPVMDFFLERGLWRVIHEPASNCFIFVFKINANELPHRRTREALIFMRRPKVWSSAVEVPLDPTRMSHVSAAICNLPQPGLCTNCGFSFDHPANNPPLVNCPKCAAPLNLFGSLTKQNAVPTSNQQSSPRSIIPPSAYSPSGVAPSIPGKPASFTTCPICWSPFEVTQELYNRVATTRESDKAASGCAQGCKVDARQLFERLKKAVPTGIIP